MARKKESGSMRKKKKEKDNLSILKYIKKCLPYFMSIKYTILGLLVMGIIFSIFDSFVPAFIANTLTLATSGEYSASITIGIIILICTILVDILGEILYRYLYIKMSNYVSNSIRKDVIDAYYKIDYKTLNSKSSGIFITRITTDPETIVNKLDRIRDYLEMALSNILVITYIFYIHYVFGFIVLIGNVLIYLVESKSSVLWSEFIKRNNKFKDERNSIISESVRGIHDIKLLDLVESFKGRVNNNIDNMFNDTIKSHKVDSKYNLTRNTISNVFTFLILIIGIIFTKNDLITIGELTALYLYRGGMFKSILYIAWTKRELKEFSLSAQRIFEVIDGEEYEKETFGTLRINELEGNIEFKNVHFGYKNDEVLKGVTFNILPKESIAIVGKSGAGKTTIINLLSRMYEINSGNINIDGYNLYDLDKYSLRKNISVIPQDPYIFNMTVKDNLLIVKPETSNEEIENVLKVCELYDYVQTLPKKENTLIGENGVNLSGGERQRLAIARALLKKSNIILFDEATSALDNETQSNIQNAINNISSYHTMIIIAHRLSTIKDCNKILVLDNGKIVGFDTHKNLYEKNSIYRNLYEKELQK